MKCPVCEVDGKKSALYLGASFSTLMCGETYYDEDGKCHNHDPNRTTTGWSCSEGHAGSIVDSTKCSSCDYGYEMQMLVRDAGTRSTDD